MKAMRCDRAAELAGAYLDQELDADTRREMAAPLGTCAACSNLTEDFSRMGRQVSALGRESAPKSLVLEVQRRLAKETMPAPLRLTAIEGLRSHPWWRRAAALLLAAGL